MLGYSVKFVDQVRNADRQKIGVRLGLLCIDKDVPAVKVAAKLEVSRMTVYQWFSGKTSPNKNSHRPKIQDLVDNFHSIEW
jgi:hypothetical protein